MGYSLPTSLSNGNTLSAAHWTQVRDSIIALAHMHIPLGGSREDPIPSGGGYKDAISAIDFEIPSGSNYDGFTWKVVVEMVTGNAATTVTPKLRNITDSTDAVVGSAATSTAWGTQQVLSVTLATGKKYRLQFSKSDDNFQAWGYGYLRRLHA